MNLERTNDMSITIDNEPTTGEFEYDKDAAEGKAISTPKAEIPTAECDGYSADQLLS